MRRNTAGALGVFAPPLVGYLGDHPPVWFDSLSWLVSEPLALSVMVVSASACAFAMVSQIFLTETRGRELHVFH